VYLQKKKSESLAGGWAQIALIGGLIETDLAWLVGDIVEPNAKS